MRPAIPIVSSVVARREQNSDAIRRTHRPPGDHHLYVRDYPETAPAVIMMHGFPDNLHLYDRAVPSPRRRSTSGAVRLPGLRTVDKPLRARPATRRPPRGHRAPAARFGGSQWPTTRPAHRLRPNEPGPPWPGPPWPRQRTRRGPSWSFAGAISPDYGRRRSKEVMLTGHEP